MTGKLLSLKPKKVSNRRNCEVPPSHQALDNNMANSYRQAMLPVQVKAAEADINLRWLVALSLFGFFAFCVFLSGLISLLIGFGLMNLSLGIIILLGALIKQVGKLCHPMVAGIFSTGSKRVDDSTTDNRDGATL